MKEPINGIYNIQEGLEKYKMKLQENENNNKDKSNAIFGDCLVRFNRIFDVWLQAGEKSSRIVNI